jgi:CRP-like cAMP-binding protein
MSTDETGYDFRALAPFDRLMPNVLDALRGQARVQQIPRQGYFRSVGSPVESVAILLEGVARIGAGEVIVDVAAAPAVIDLASSVAGGRSLVSISAVRPSRFLELPRESALHALFGDPEAAAATARILAFERSAATLRMRELVGGSVEERLAALLDRLAERHGSPLDDGRMMALSLRRSDYAAMINATTETVSRTVARWERAGAARSSKVGLWWRGRPVEETRAAAGERSNAAARILS